MLRAISWMMLLTLFLFASLAMGEGVQWEQEKGSWKASETLIIDLGTGPELKIEDFAGDVTVTGYDRQDIELTLVYHAARSMNKNEADRRFSDTRPVIETRSRRLVVQGQRQRKLSFSQTGWYELTLSVPLKLEADLNTVGGDLEIISVEGHLMLATAGGDVELNGTKGRLTLSTAGGDVRVRNHVGMQTLTSSGGNVTLTEDSGLVNVSTSGGDVELKSVSGRLAVSTSGGDIVMADINAQRAKVESTGGHIHLIDATCSEISTFSCHGGDISTENTAGPLDMEVSGGDIDVVNHDGSMVAFSSAGDVIIEQITGALEVNLNAGDLHASLSETSSSPFLWDLNINTGDVTLGIPEGAKVAVNASVNNYGSAASIQSDYPLTQSREGNSTTARCTLNGGGSDIHVSVGGGEIRIEKI